MALVPATLQAALTATLQGMPPSAEASAQQMAAAYNGYAVGAMAGGGAVVVLPPQEELFWQGGLLPAMGAASGTPVAFATAWANAVETYWLVPPVAVAGATVGAVTAFPGKAALIASLTAVFSNPANTAETCAAGMASALDAATRTVVATVAPPEPPAPVPLT